MAMVAEREMPARQCTSTQPLEALAFSAKKAGEGHQEQSCPPGDLTPPFPPSLSPHSTLLFFHLITSPALTFIISATSNDSTKGLKSDAFLPFPTISHFSVGDFSVCHQLAQLSLPNDCTNYSFLLVTLVRTKGTFLLSYGGSWTSPYLY